MLAAAVRAGEQGVLAIECNRADGAFDDVGIDLDATVVDEVRQALPARQCVSDSLCEPGLLTDQVEPGAAPGFELVDNRSALLLADGTALVGGATTDLAFDRVEASNAFECLAGDRCRTDNGEFMEASADVGPAERKSYVATLGKRPVAGIAVDLKNAREASEMGDRPLGLAIGRIHIGDGGRIGATPGPVIAGIGP